MAFYSEWSKSGLYEEGEPASPTTSWCSDVTFNPNPNTVVIKDVNLQIANPEQIEIVFADTEEFSQNAANQPLNVEAVVDEEIVLQNENPVQILAEESVQHQPLNVEAVVVEDGGNDVNNVRNDVVNDPTDGNDRMEDVDLNAENNKYNNFVIELHPGSNATISSTYKSI